MSAKRNLPQSESTVPLAKRDRKSVPMAPTKASPAAFVRANLPKPNVDVSVENHGSIFLFRPLGPKAEAWIEENVSREGFHPDWPTLVVEHRYARSLAEGMTRDGLVLR